MKFFWGGFLGFFGLFYQIFICGHAATMLKLWNRHSHQKRWRRNEEKWNKNEEDMTLPESRFHYLCFQAVSPLICCRSSTLVFLFFNFKMYLLGPFIFTSCKIIEKTCDSSCCLMRLWAHAPLHYYHMSYSYHLFTYCFHFARSLLHLKMFIWSFASLN